MTPDRPRLEREMRWRKEIDAWRVAEELGWTKTYDAEYVALARLSRCRLFTIDARLRRGAGHVVEIIGPADLPGDL